MKKLGLLGLIPFYLLANPSGLDVIQGSCKINQEGKSLHLEVSDRAILHWKNFSIEQDELTKFLQPNSSSVALNKVTSGAISHLQGLLEANGKVILINPNGIVVSKSGVIDTGSIIATTLDIHSDTAFMNNEDLEFSGDSKSGVINYGKIQSRNGDVVFISYSSQNHGNIDANNGQVTLASADKVLLKPCGSKRIYIESKGADIARLEDNSPYSLAFATLDESDALDIMVDESGETFLVSSTVVTGSISSNMGEEGGEVQLIGKEVIVDQDAVIDVSAENGGGKIFVGGGFQGNDHNLANSLLTYVGKDVKLLARSFVEGNGGQVVLWSDGQTYFDGFADVRGGDFLGKGGLIEVSGLQGFSFFGNTLRSAANGRAGRLILDPESDVVIHRDNVHGGSFIRKKWLPIHKKSYIEIGDQNTPGTLLYELSQGDVFIQTAGSDFSGGRGQIILEEDLVYHLFRGANLTFQTGGNIFLKGKLVNTGKGDIIIDTCKNLTLNAEIGNGNVALGTFSGDVLIKDVKETLLVKGGKNGYAVLGYPKAKEVVTGSVIIDHVGKDLILNGGKGLESPAVIGSYDSPTSSGSIVINQIDNDLKLKANKGFCQIGHVQTSNDGSLSGDILFGLIGGKVELVASEHAKAHIGHGGEGHYVYDQMGNIHMAYVGKGLDLFADGMYAQVGHANNIEENGNKIGNINLQIDGDINIYSGTDKRGYALIGHGGVFGEFKKALIKGDIVVGTSGELNVFGGAGDTFAAIGFGLQDVLLNKTVSINSDKFSVGTFNDVNVVSGQRSDAVIGAYLPILPDKVDLRFKTIAIETEGYLNIEGFTEFDAQMGNYSEAVIGLRPKPFFTVEEYSKRMGFFITAEKGISVQGALFAKGKELHPVYIRGINKKVPSILASNGDVSFRAGKNGEAAIIHDGPLQVASLEGFLEFLSVDNNDAYVEVYGGNLEMKGEEKIILKDDFHQSGKIHIIKQEDKHSPTIFYSGAIYRESIELEDPLDTITITQLEPDDEREFSIIKTWDDFIFTDTFFEQDSPKLAILCNGQSQGTCYTNTTTTALYEANILVSEYLFRVTPLEEFLGYREHFSLCNRTAYLTCWPNCYWIRKPYLFLKGYTYNPFYW